MNSEKHPRGALEGLRVIDLSTVLLGPLAAQNLGDMGADVIKIESPAGDAIRDVGPQPTKGCGALFAGANRNKRSLVLDLKTDSGMAALIRLIKTADVLLHNIRPQAIARLNLGYDTVSKHRPDIIYCGTYGFSALGPYGEKPAYDDMIQAVSGVAWLQGINEEEPRYIKSVIADKATGLTVTWALMTALFHRERTGEGQSIEVPMFETMVGFNMVEHAMGLAYETPRDEGAYPRTTSEYRRPHKTSDGYVGVLPYTEKHWSAFFEITGRQDLAADERFDTYANRHLNIDALYAELASIMLTRTTAQWLEVLTPAQIPVMPVNALTDLMDDEHLQATDFWNWREHPVHGPMRMPGIGPRFEKTPGSLRRTAPVLGQHSHEVLNDIGYSDHEIGALIDAGVTMQAEI